MPTPLPLLKIQDISTLLTDPFASMILADMEEEVLWFELPARPDLVKMLESKIKVNFADHSTINLSKKSLEELLIDFRGNNMKI